MSPKGNVDDEWHGFVESRRQAELESLIREEGLKVDATRTFVESALRDGVVRTEGVAVTRLLPPSSRFTPDGERAAMKQQVLSRLADFVARFMGLGV